MVPSLLIKAVIVSSAWFLFVGTVMSFFQFVLAWFPEKRVAKIEAARQSVVVPLFAFPVFCVVLSFAALACFGLWAMFRELIL